MYRVIAYITKSYNRIGLSLIQYNNLSVKEIHLPKGLSKKILLSEYLQVNST